MWRLSFVLTSVVLLQTFSSRTLGVRVDVMVTDGRVPVAGLTAADFELRDNGVLQRVDVIDAFDVPINVMLALDTSVSIRGQRQTDLIAAATTLVDGLKPVDRAGLVTFNHAIASTIAPTTDLSAVRAALQGITPYGRTALMDGVYVALTSTLDQSARFLLVVCTDGTDTMSWLRPAEVLDASQRANAVIYSVTPSGARASALKRLTDVTGGQALEVRSSRDLRGAFQRILTEFRSRYVLAYSPQGVAPGGFHRLEIAVPRRTLTVKARSGYVGVSPATAMRVHRASVLCSAAMLIVAATPIRGQGQTPESVEAIHRWVTLVREHVPGRPDASVQAMTSMTYSARRTLNGAFPPFIRILRDPEALVTRSEPEKQLASVARTARLRIGAGAFLKRAAMLHADAVVFESRFPPPSDDAPPRVPPQRDATAGRRSIPLPPVPPLLTSDRVTLTRDGELLGDAPLNWHLPFARSLLEELRKLAEPEGADACAEARAVPELARQPCIQVDLSRVSAEDAAFIAQWYHAVTAYLFARGMNGDANFHLREAQRVLPNDPQVVFDRASYAETFGLPLYQAVIEAAGGARVDVIPAEEKTNEEAERLYRRALEMDASFVEARIRLARLLDHRGRRDDAAAHIARALEERPSGAVRFYALIVAGRIAAGRGRHDDALRHYRDAAAMYPDAQSALLGASHAALMLADVPQTLAPLADLGAAAPNRGADPWPEYHLGSGRDVNELFDALWASFSK